MDSVATEFFTGKTKIIDKKIDKDPQGQWIFTIRNHILDAKKVKKQGKIKKRRKKICNFKKKG